MNCPTCGFEPVGYDWDKVASEMNDEILKLRARLEASETARREAERQLAEAEREAGQLLSERVSLSIELEEAERQLADMRSGKEVAYWKGEPLSYEQLAMRLATGETAERRVAELEATVVPTIRGLRAYGSWNANALADKLEAWLARAALASVSPQTAEPQHCPTHGGPDVGAGYFECGCPVSQDEEPADA